MRPTSWAAAAKQSGTEHYISQIRARGLQDKAYENMVSCMKEALRMRKRQWLRDATYIFLGFDDKNGRKLLRFKCDTPEASACFDAAG